jgi:CheY-like chemotaxis protein
VQRALTPVARQPLTILVVEDVEETRNAIERLLTANGYRVRAGHNEDDAIESARLHSPDLILVSLGRDRGQRIHVASRIREAAGSDASVPVIIFCDPDLREGEEQCLADNIHLTRPDNFDQLRNLIRRLVETTRDH